MKLNISSEHAEELKHAVVSYGVTTEQYCQHDSDGNWAAHTNAHKTLVDLMQFHKITELVYGDICVSLIGPVLTVRPVFVLT